MADARSGARSQRSGSSAPTRTRPKSPLRPYVPPAAPPTVDGTGTDRPARLELPAPRDPVPGDLTTPAVAEFAAAAPPPTAALPPPPAQLPPAPLPPAQLPPAPLPAPVRPHPRPGFPAAPAPGWSAAHQTPLSPPAPATTARAAAAPATARPAPTTSWSMTPARWVRLAAVLLVALVVVAVGLWWQRDTIGDVVSDLRGLNSEESAPASGVGAQLDGVAVGIAKVQRGPHSPGS